MPAKRTAPIVHANEAGSFSEMGDLFGMFLTEGNEGNQENRFAPSSFVHCG